MKEFHNSSNIFFVLSNKESKIYKIIKKGTIIGIKIVNIEN
jgi:hypothetical protein